MNIHLRTSKHFESAVGFPVDFVIGRVQSGKVLSPEGCCTVTPLPALTLNAVHRIVRFVHRKYSVWLVYTVLWSWLFRM